MQGKFAQLPRSDGRLDGTLLGFTWVRLCIWHHRVCTEGLRRAEGATMGQGGHRKRSRAAYLQFRHLATKLPNSLQQLYNFYCTGLLCKGFAGSSALSVFLSGCVWLAFSCQGAVAWVFHDFLRLDFSSLPIFFYIRISDERFGEYPSP